MERSYGTGSMMDIVLWVVLAALFLLYLGALLFSERPRMVPETAVAPVHGVEPTSRPEPSAPVPMV